MIQSFVHLKLCLPHLPTQLYNTALPKRFSGPFDTFHIAQYDRYPPVTTAALRQVKEFRHHIHHLLKYYNLPTACSMHSQVHIQLLT